MTKNTPERKSLLSRILNKSTIKRMAGERSFERGEKYFEQGSVSSLIEHQGSVITKVTGSQQYQVRLWIEDDKIQFSCSCPVGQDGTFCKHCVAVGLTCLNQDEQKSTTEVTMDDVSIWLATQNKEVLIKIIVEQSLNDDRLRRQLLLKTSKNKTCGVDVAAYQQAIDEAIYIDGFISYRESYDYALGIEEVIDSIEELLNEGYSSEVIELAEYALDAVEDALNFADDSSGQIGSLLCDLQDLHFRACAAAKPNPEDLARRLFKWELKTDYDTFQGAMKTYADILGENGIAMYKKLAETEWKKVSVLMPDSSSEEKYGKRYRITKIMEHLAEETGDVEALIAIKKHDLSSGWAYLQIAETYKKARKRDLALEWAEKGIATFPDKTDSRLRDFLIEEYHHSKRHDEAMDIVWTEFSESPSLHQYKKLKDHAEQVNQWQTWRSKALEFIRKSILNEEKQQRRQHYSWYQKTDNTTLVQVFLWEEDIEMSWKEACEGECSNSLWLELAEKRKERYPEDAIPIYQKMVEPTIDRKNNDAYNEAVDFLKKIEILMKRLGQDSEFVAYLESILIAHKPKRNLMKLLQKNWPQNAIHSKTF